MNTSAIYIKLHIVNRIGGGREGSARSSHAVDVAQSVFSSQRSAVRFPHSSIYSDYCSRRGISRLFLCLLWGALALLLVGCRPKATVCGVPYEGKTPWELAAMIHANACGTFVPVSVNEYSDKAYIEGYCLPDETPAQIVCDLANGEVFMAVVYQLTIEE